MTVAWTAHRFSGGLLVLDVANTVVLRDDAEKTFDRFVDPGELPRFAEAASRFRADELGGARLSCEAPERVREPMIALREAADALFRRGASGGGMPAPLLARLATACAGLLADDAVMFGLPDAPFGVRGSQVPLGAAVAWSALSLLAGTETRRLRICGNCGWLFVDRSRNGSRIWCDMAVCGNRRKAQRHYHRGREAREKRNG
jgi:predicted RNA-binding Zn ribbon-like protein